MSRHAEKNAPTLCPPGTKMLLEVTGFPDKLATICVGHVRPRFVVTTMPVVPENNHDAVHQMLYPDNTIIVRFLLDGTVMGFSAKIIRPLQIPFPLLFFSYPSRLECHDLRRHRRVPCLIPAETELGKAAILGMIVDLSLTGCQFATSLALGETPPPAVNIDDTLVLRCGLFGSSGNSELPCSVKRVDVTTKRMDIGLKFTGISQDLHKSLDTYLHHALAVLG